MFHPEFKTSQNQKYNVYGQNSPESYIDRVALWGRGPFTMLSWIILNLINGDASEKR